MKLSKINFNQKLIGKLQVTFGLIALVSLLWYRTSSTSPLVPIANQNTIAIEISDQQPPADAKAMTEQSDQVTPKSGFSERRYTVKKGDTLETIFKRKRLSMNEMYEILETDEPYLQLDVLKPGDQLNFRINRSDNLLESLSRVIDPSKTVIYQRNNETFTYNESLTPTTTIAEVTRGQIEGSFYLSASSTGLSDNSVMTITQLLKNTLNFKRDLRAGDHFQVIMERETIEGQAIGKDRLLAARILSRGKEFGAYLHDDGSYYNAEGESLIPALLRYPTRKKFRISSHFNPRRVHPVTGRVKPHNGVDFAMPTGTPIISTGHGRVTRVANHRYAGKYIDIDEFGPYSTRFLHLSKILVKKGQQVERGQVIALSGNTGRSTGPHLHYELHIKGRPVNPMTADIPMLKSIPNNKIESFHLQVADMQSLMLSETEIVYLDKQHEKENKNAKFQNTSAQVSVPDSATAG